MNTNPINSPRFPLGSVVATPGALEALGATDILKGLLRHADGDWGDLDPHDRRENDLSLESGWRLLSAYTAVDSTRFWIITEADRSSTCVLLPDEY